MPSEHEIAAERIREAYNRGPIAPLRDVLASEDGDAAYRVQSLNTQHWVKQGRRIIGRKIGLTSKAIQKQLGVDRPDYGVLFDDMLIADGGILSPSRLIQPRVEAEVALVLARDVDLHEPSVHDVISATAYALPALEIVDSRIADWKISYADTVADNASSGALVLGSEPRLLTGLDLYACGMVMEANGEIVSTGVGAACLGHPLLSAAWLARVLVQHGEMLRSGDVILTGALGPMTPLRTGAAIHATVGGLGSVGFRFTESGQ